MVHQPRIIFADELTGNLDSHTTHEIMCSLQEAVKTHGQTLITVTHDGDVAKFADRIVHMTDGKIVSAAASCNEDKGMVIQAILFLLRAKHGGCI